MVTQRILPLAWELVPVVEENEAAYGRSERNPDTALRIIETSLKDMLCDGTSI